MNSSPLVTPMHTVIVANGLIGHEDIGKSIAMCADLLICADGGARYVLRWGLMPAVVIGDMDSLDETTLQQLEEADALVIRHSPHKDETDLELALRYALQRGAHQISILGALGGRLDHTLANILLLAWPILAHVEVSIIEGPERIMLSRTGLTLRGDIGDIVSLLPLSAEVKGIVTNGLEYPLRGESLLLGPSRGVSNVMISQEATIHHEEGLLIVTHHRRTAT